MDTSDTSAPTTSLVPVLGRMFWAMFGPLFLLLLAIKNVQNPDGWTAPADIAFFVILGGIALGRWLEFRWGQPRTATGNPANTAHLVRFVIVAVACGAVVWFATNLIGNR